MDYRWIRLQIGTRDRIRACDPLSATARVFCLDTEGLLVHLEFPKAGEYLTRLRVECDSI